jgi:hypothetical protein
MIAFVFHLSSQVIVVKELKTVSNYAIKLSVPLHVKVFNHALLRVKANRYILSSRVSDAIIAYWHVRFLRVMAKKSAEIQISQAFLTRWHLQLHTNDCRCTCFHYFCFRLSAVLFQCHEGRQCPTSCRQCPVSCARSFPPLCLTIRHIISHSSTLLSVRSVHFTFILGFFFMSTTAAYNESRPYKFLNVGRLLV